MPQLLPLKPWNKSSPMGKQAHRTTHLPVSVFLQLRLVSGWRPKNRSEISTTDGLYLLPLSIHVHISLALLNRSTPNLAKKQANFILNMTSQFQKIKWRHLAMTVTTFSHMARKHGVLLAARQHAVIKPNIWSPNSPDLNQLDCVIWGALQETGLPSKKFVLSWRTEGSNHRSMHGRNCRILSSTTERQWMAPLYGVRSATERRTHRTHAQLTCKILKFWLCVTFLLSLMYFFQFLM